MVRALSVVIAIVVATVSAARAEEPFYQGKRLTLLINFAPGGPTDVEGRLLAKHIAKHIAGNPLIVVQNKDGASGMVGATYLGEVGPKDGTMFGYLTGTAWNSVIDPAAFRVPFASYAFIGAQPGNAVYYMRADTPPGIKTAADLMKAEGLVVGGLGADSSKDLVGAPDLRYARPAIPLRHRLSLQQHRAARVAERRDQRAFGIDAGLFQRRRAEPGEDRRGDAAVVRRHL